LKDSKANTISRVSFGRDALAQDTDFVGYRTGYPAGFSTQHSSF
jgi:hypothetical protein